MFDNIGSKIKTLAKTVCYIGILCSVISGFVMMPLLHEIGIVIGLLIMVVGSLLSWIGSFVIYGFGEIVENSDIRTELAVKQAMSHTDDNNYSPQDE